MSHFTCTVHAYDSYNRVRCVVRMHDVDLPYGSPRLALALDFDFLGVGESDPGQWMKDVVSAIRDQLELERLP